MLIRLITLSMIFYFCSNQIFAEVFFKPLTANPFEARTGAMYQVDDDRLRLDIGINLDMFKLDFPDTNSMSIAAEFFTMTLLRTESNFKFPVEASDYYFGINASLKDTLFNTPSEFRFRLAHISAHLVDGYSTNGVFSELPFVYSRDFIDITAAARVSKSQRLYAGFRYLFNVLPQNAEKFTLFAGGDGQYELNNDFAIQYGYHSTVYGEKHSNSLQIGIIFKTSNKAGIALNYNYFEGHSVHGMFWDRFERYSAIGFQLYFY